MRRRIHGFTGGGRRRRLVMIALAGSLAVLGAFLITNAFAVHDLEFQLDGDTTETPYSAPAGSNPRYDWNNIFNVSNSGGTQTVSDNSALVGEGKTFEAANFVRDFQSGTNCTLNSTSTTFCTGDETTYATGAKDSLGIGSKGGWECKFDANVNSKIDIMNAYVLSYINPANGHKLIYFGMEKNKNNGTNDVGFWFLQSKAVCAAPSGHAPFKGKHQNNDTLVVSEFTNGGGVSTIKAFRWAAAASGPLSGDGGCIDSKDNPDPKTGGCNGLPLETGADCKTTGGGGSNGATGPTGGTSDTLCATTNAKCTTAGSACALKWNEEVTTKWLTSDATKGVGNKVVEPDFFEGGVDITKAFEGHGGGAAPSCFNTIVPDTRSSASIEATLFDFTLNQIGECTGALSTKENAQASREINAEGKLSSGTDEATLKITGSQSWGGTLTWYLCGPNVTTCDNKGFQVESKTVSSTDGGTSASTAKTYTSGETTVTSAGGSGVYCWHAEFKPNKETEEAGIGPQEDNGANECFTVTPKTPTLTTSASCSATPCVLGSTLEDTATLTGTANNPDPAHTGGNTTYPTINGGTIAADKSITWKLYGPGTGGAAQCTTAKTGAPTPSSVTVSGDNTYPFKEEGMPPTKTVEPVKYTTTSTDKVGKYEFAASYPGEGPNTTAPTSQVTCDETGANGEQVEVIGSATSSSAQRWLPNDRVVLKSTEGTTLHGTLTVTLYKGAFAGTAGNCTIGTGAPVSGQSYGTTGDVGTTGNSFTFNTTNSTFVVGTNADGTTGGTGTDGEYFWLIHYEDNSLTSPKDRCETSTITHNDG